MTKADKQRILSTPSVRGEFVIKGRYGIEKVYPFKSLYDSNHGDVIRGACILVDNRSQIFLSVYDSEVKFWVPGFSGDDLVQRVPYKNITILWCTYMGENSTIEIE